MANPVQPRTINKNISEHRRCNKPIMEKKRRARINNCLNELKNLILDAMKKDPARHSKLEKADILEMTVKHLESLHRQQTAMNIATDPNVLNKYKAGFNQCVDEVNKFLQRNNEECNQQLDPLIKNRLLSHLTNCLNNNNNIPKAIESDRKLIRVQIPEDSGNKRIMELVPTCLPSGDIAFVLPKHHNINNKTYEESKESLAARTAIVTPISLALDLSLASTILDQQQQQEKQMNNNVWRPW